jgi:uncharacterized protein
MSVAPFHVLAKPIGPICNLDCTYCFYLEKETLYPQASKWAMASDVLESYIRQYIEQQQTNEISFAWQGGEPTLLGVEYFQQVVALEARYAKGKRIHNAFQTNGVLLDDIWGRFFAENDFLVGISIDGPRVLHDAYRVDKGGRSSFDHVMRGIETLQRNHVEFNTLTTVHRANAGSPLEVLSGDNKVSSSTSANPFILEGGSEFLKNEIILAALSRNHVDVKTPAKTRQDETLLSRMTLYYFSTGVPLPERSRQRRDAIYSHC